MFSDSIERFQAFIDPLSGAIRLEAFWVKVAREGPGSPPVLGILRQELGKSYSSLASANSKAQTFPAFPAIASRFGSEPFTAIVDLLEALRNAQALEEAEAKSQRDKSLSQEPPFEGAP